MGNKRKRHIIFTAFLTIVMLASTVAANMVAIYWDKPLQEFVGVIGEGVNDASSQENLFTSDYQDKAEILKTQEEFAKQVVREGVVMLKNDTALPLTEKSKVSLFGIASASGSASGSGSGAVSGEASTIYSSLVNAGFEVNETLHSFYQNSTHEHGKGTGPGNGDAQGDWKLDEVPQSEFTAELKNSYKNYNDAAIVVFSRQGGEGGDLPTEMSRFGGAADEHYLQLSKEERELLASIEQSGEFSKTIILINSAGAMELGFVDQAEYGVDAALWYGGTGKNGIEAVGEILKGEANPSGRLVDTYVYDNFSAPSMQNFGDFRYVNANNELVGNAYLNYGEGIYVGYRYYETRYEDKVMGTPNTGDYNYGESVIYPFGYGLSYSSFEWGGYQLAEDGDNYTVNVTVTNTGDQAGKDVVQLYAQTPYVPGGVEKASVNLVNFAKTKELNPGESETLTIQVNKADLASYDYLNEKGYILDAGRYYLTAAQNAHAAVNNILALKGYTVENGMTADGNASLAGSLEVNALSKVEFEREVTNQFDTAAAADFEYLSRSNWSKMDNSGLTYATGVMEGVSNVTDAKKTAKTILASEELVKNLQAEGYDSSGAPPISSRNYPAASAYKYDQKTSFNLADMIGLDYNDPKWDEILDAMKLSDMHKLFNKSGYGTMAIESINKPKTYEYDGPAGISNMITGEGSFSYPTSPMVASTWNIELAKEQGRLVGEDALNTKTSGWYAPAINIHRTPFSGRNYEYFSEDPVLTGLISTNVTKAVQAKGVYVYIKHFALNDQETNRAANGSVATWSNEQAIREIYLKPFEINVKQGGARGIMMAFNRIGYTPATTHYNLITNVTRGEWGFVGVIISDYMSSQSANYADQFLAAGGDMFLSTAGIPLNDAKQDWARAELRRSTKNTLFNIANSLAMNGLANGGTYSSGFPVYKIILIVLDVLVLGILALIARNIYRVVKETDESFEARRKLTQKRRVIIWCAVGIIIVILAVAFYVLLYPIIKDALLM
ncbi:glycoside hydrolase family 3 N-terminal domain-containing protein [Paenibacillus brevis]|uniref:Glycoside hydrolase family 3 C-terminal domain-containing protein n=1 Tax=Paenibacillus brevis TaxID=2841508 RepID=A0ABS6FQD1_9BACL|nr:glycoside hydrolase family 3 N-terminal domain-containing protein [Paenibacillus brevis]MBU5671401.1 glycoside hydrolase family 3 C-terminal domain-containing protein [Paenibacillus brevis]